MDGKKDLQSLWLSERWQQELRLYETLESSSSEASASQTGSLTAAFRESEIHLESWWSLGPWESWHAGVSSLA